MEKWVEIRKGGEFEQWGEKLGIHPVIARVIRNREIEPEQMEQFLYGDLDSLHDPSLMKDLDKTVEILNQKIENGAKIRIIGDYDIDGVCAAYLLKTGLMRAGAVVDEVIPDRIRDGYGLNVQLLQEAIESGVDTILTCDNGISAVEQIAYGKEQGLTILITDHHEVPEVLPVADAIVDPKQEACQYPFREICGAVVAYKLIQQLYKSRGISNTEWIPFLEIAAFATVGDVMELRGENRIIVKYGLNQMKNSSHAGLRALIELCGLQGKDITPYHVGFVLGPCINATGRLETAEEALRLLEAQTEEKAVEIAKHLQAINEQRKSMTEEFRLRAFKMVEESDWKTDTVYVVYLPECHESLAGIIAGRLRERYHRPSFVLADGEEAVKGSGRSIAGYDMFAELEKVKDLFIQFGGHKMAAGLSIMSERVEELRRRLNENSTLTETDLAEKVSIDASLPFSQISEKFVQELSMLEPCGNGNSKPVFATRGVHIGGGRIFGKNRNVYKGTAKDESGVNLDCIYFGDAEAFQDYLKTHDSVLITYYPGVNEYQSNKMLQIIIQKYK